MRVKIVCFFLVLFPWLSIGTRLPACWREKLTELCQNFQPNCPPAVSGTCYLHESLNSPILILFPPVILWSPLEQLSFLHLSIACPKCLPKHDHVPICATGWTDGGLGDRSEPRKIYGAEGVTLLVGRIYKCSNGHEVLSYHPNIIQCFPSCFVPFKLWHKTGFSMDLINLIASLITAGMSLGTIRDFYNKRQLSWYYNQRQKFEKLSLPNLPNFPSLDTWKECFPTFTPSIHAIAGCFLANFWEKDIVYTKNMQCTTIDEDNSWLSLDHTFSSAKNIGFNRVGDNRWITQYEALFCVLNANGQVLSWRLTPSLSFADIEPDLVAVKNRLDLQQKQLSDFYIDNCCTWRKKLQKVFGNQLNVYLDIFHAVKRLSEKVSKRHSLRKECMMEWKMVFRDPTDQGDKRHSPTPSPHIMEKNLDSFLQRWKDAEYKGQHILGQAALKEITKIRVHIKKGCLSGILPGRGTNRNENLHKDLNKVMASSKYGVELAYALLTVIFFKHNEKMKAKLEKCSEQPIEYYHQKYSETSLPDTGERFGLKFSAATSSLNKEENFCELKLMTCTYRQLYQRILNTPPPLLGHSRQQNSYTEDEEDNISPDNSLADIEDEEQSIHISTLKKILMQAVSWFFVHQSLTSVSTTASLRIDQIPFMVSTLSDLSNPMLDTSEEEKVSLQRLDNLLTSWNLSRLEVERNGNCLFYSIAFNLVSQLESGNADLEVILANVGVSKHHSLTDIAGVLRSSVVKEWLGDHSKDYQKFMTEGQLFIQAEEFLQDGTFSSDIGDLAITALSNVLQAPIVVFTSRANLQPIHIQNPTYSQMRVTNPVFLAYLHTGPGHYDAVIHQGQDRGDLSSTNLPNCTCGRKGGKGNACSFSLSKYTCRCPCYNGGHACSQYCKCRGCTNSFGTKSEAVATSPNLGQKRKRVAHPSQAVPLRGKKV